jgi:hypothetical protein
MRRVSQCLIKHKKTLMQIKPGLTLLSRGITIGLCCEPSAPRHVGQHALRDRPPARNATEEYCRCR